MDKCGSKNIHLLWEYAHPGGRKAVAFGVKREDGLMAVGLAHTTPVNAKLWRDYLCPRVETFERYQDYDKRFATLVRKLERDGYEETNAKADFVPCHFRTVDEQRANRDIIQQLRRTSGDIIVTGSLPGGGDCTVTSKHGMGLDGGMHALVTLEVKGPGVRKTPLTLFHANFVPQSDYDSKVVPFVNRYSDWLAVARGARPKKTDVRALAAMQLLPGGGLVGRYA